MRIPQCTFVLPMLLVVAIEGAHNQIKVDTKLIIHGLLQYDLQAVVWYHPRRAHYKATIKLRGKWYTYDDLLHAEVAPVKNDSHNNEFVARDVNDYLPRLLYYIHPKGGQHVLDNQ